MSARPFSTHLLALLASFGVGAAAQAQQKVVAPAKAMVAPAVSDDQFDQWVFQQDRNASGARQRLNSLLTLQLEDIERACALTEGQKKKLQLAGRGDLKRFFDRYEAVKQKFQLIKNDQQKQQEIWQDISPLQMSLQGGLFHEDSLLSKSLPNTLTGDQLARYDAITRERRAFRHRATIELAVTTLEQQSTPLRDVQRRELIKLLTKQTKPSRKSGPYDYYVVMFQLGRLPEEKLKPLFDNMQWQVMSRQLDQFKGYDMMLRRSGQLPDEDDDATDADAQRAASQK
jgi:hypothetical protein